MIYEQPATIEEACALLSRQDGISRILSGGTDVMVQLKSEMVEPDLIVNVKHLEGMRSITDEDGGFRVGAAVSGAELGEHAGVRKLWPGVVEGMELIGSTQVQGRATMVGNLCNGSPAADAVPGLVAADAVARIHGVDGARDCPVADIPAGPGKTTLAKGEIITSIYLPARPAQASDAYLRFTPRTEMDIAVASAAVSLVLDDNGFCTTARVALGAVGPKVILVPEAGAALLGSSCDGKALKALVDAVEKACTPITDKRGTIEFRIMTAGVLAKRAAVTAYKRAGGAV
jgi:carbon-monoxide dehydrogenase medium subunit